MEDTEKRYRVRAAHCDHQAPDADVYRVLQQITAPLERSWARLEAARQIVVKFNIVWPPARIRCTDGRRQELVDEVVARGVLRLLRERTRARILVADTTQEPGDVHFLPLLAEFGAEYVECNHPPFAAYPVPGGGRMFSRYLLNPCFRESDAVVSVATLKSHAFMGVTLCSKNLFGLCPIHPDSRPRTYFHHIIRLPYVLADLARIVQPCLNIIDGLVGQSGREWGGEARVADTLIAGDHVTATDLCAARLMGHDPYADWPEPPFRRDHSHLLASVESGFGPRSLDEVDYACAGPEPDAAFDSEPVDPRERVLSWRRTMCEQALFYRDHREEIVARYPNEYIYLQEGEVIWHDPHRIYGFSRRNLSGERKDSAIWLKYVDADEAEGERFERYEEERGRLT